MQPAPEPDEGQYATPEEARRAIESLSDPDHVKLMLIAIGFRRSRLRGSAVEPEDLLQEALAKTLDGTRTWNKRISILKHLDGVMKSDSAHEADRRSMWPTRSLEEGEGEGDEEIPGRHDTLLEDRDEFERVLRFFEKDKVALRLLRLKGDGNSPSEIQRELGIGKTPYESALKRIRRHTTKHLADEGE